MALRSYMQLARCEDYSSDSQGKKSGWAVLIARHTAFGEFLSADKLTRIHLHTATIVALYVNHPLRKLHL